MMLSGTFSQWVNRYAELPREEFVRGVKEYWKDGAALREGARLLGSESTPLHLRYLLILAARGREEPQLVDALGALLSHAPPRLCQEAVGAVCQLPPWTAEKVLRMGGWQAGHPLWQQAMHLLGQRYPLWRDWQLLEADAADPEMGPDGWRHLAERLSGHLPDAWRNRLAALLERTWDERHDVLLGLMASQPLADWFYPLCRLQARMDPGNESAFEIWTSAMGAVLSTRTDARKLWRTRLSHLDARFWGGVGVRIWEHLDADDRQVLLGTRSAWTVSVRNRLLKRLQLENPPRRDCCMELLGDWGRKACDEDAGEVMVAMAHQCGSEAMMTWLETQTVSRRCMLLEHWPRSLDIDGSLRTRIQEKLGETPPDALEAPALWGLLMRQPGEAEWGLWRRWSGMVPRSVVWGRMLVRALPQAEAGQRPWIWQEWVGWRGEGFLPEIWGDWLVVVDRCLRQEPRGEEAWWWEQTLLFLERLPSEHWGRALVIMEQWPVSGEQRPWIREEFRMLRESLVHDGGEGDALERLHRMCTRMEMGLDLDGRRRS